MPNSDTPVSVDHPHNLEAYLHTMEHDLRLRIDSGALRDPLMIGIHTGGVWVAKRLHAALGLSEPLGKLSIAFYRDDFTHIGLHPQVSPSSLPFDIEGRDIILVDDVLYTGRTIRAALEALLDYGRPRCVELLTLIDRGHRELPIHADYVGRVINTSRQEHVDVMLSERDGEDSVNLTTAS